MLTLTTLLMHTALVTAPVPLSMRADDRPAAVPAQEEVKEPASHAVYLQADGATLGLVNMGSLSLNYDKRFGRWYALHAGVGYASWGWFLTGSGAQAVAVELEAKLLLGGWNHSLEVGAGVAGLDVFHVAADYHCYGDGGDDPTDEGCSTEPYLDVAPVASLAYRYQPSRGGTFVRAGVGWHYGFGVGASFAIGTTF